MVVGYPTVLIIIRIYLWNFVVVYLKSQAGLACIMWCFLWGHFGMVGQLYDKCHCVTTKQRICQRSLVNRFCLH